jgi:hypothetical protein
LVLGVVLAVLTMSAPALARTRVLFALSDARIVEASGLGVGVRSPGVLYLQNDSGDPARFFAVDATTGRTRTVCSVPGARNVDWEDLAVAPDVRGVSSVWLADIGDNDELRREVQVYRIDEPVLGPTSAPDLATGPAQVWRLRYPDGPHNAEAIAVDPVRQRMFIFTKALLGRSQVFSVSTRAPGRGVRTLARVGHLDLSFTGTPGGPNPVGQVTVTGASMSPDGSVLIVRSYTDAYLWRLPGGDVATALAIAPVRFPLPPEPLGEGIALRGRQALIDSEGVGTSVYEVDLPALGAARPTVVPGSPALTRSPSVARVAAPAAGSAPSVWAWVSAVAGAGLLAVVAAVAARRRSRRH